MGASEREGGRVEGGGMERLRKGREGVREQEGEGERDGAAE